MPPGLGSLRRDNAALGCNFTIIAPRASEDCARQDSLGRGRDFEFGAASFLELLAELLCARLLVPSVFVVLPVFAPASSGADSMSD